MSGHWPRTDSCNHCCREKLPVPQKRQEEAEKSIINFDMKPLFPLQKPRLALCNAMLAAIEGLDSRNRLDFA
jgi:hypothetical protein